MQRVVNMMALRCEFFKEGYASDKMYVMATGEGQEEWDGLHFKGKLVARIGVAEAQRVLGAKMAGDLSLEHQDNKALEDCRGALEVSKRRIHSAEQMREFLLVKVVSRALFGVEVSPMSERALQQLDKEIMVAVKHKRGMGRYACSTAIRHGREGVVDIQAIVARKVIVEFLVALNGSGERAPVGHRRSTRLVVDEIADMWGMQPGGRLRAFKEAKQLQADPPSRALPWERGIRYGCCCYRRCSTHGCRQC